MFENKYSENNFFIKFFRFICLKIYDAWMIHKHGRPFSEFGLTLYCGRQGGGKTTAMVEYLQRMQELYPKMLVVTNFGYKKEDYSMTDWQDFFNIRNGDDGVIFAIDELQNEFDSAGWRDFPESLLSEITQQRKQKIKIVATSQVFNRVAKPLREQCFEVVECFTIAGRWTFCRAFDAYDYNAVIESPEKKLKLRRLWRKSFIQDKKLRDLYDSYAKIQRIEDRLAIKRPVRAK